MSFFRKKADWAEKGKLPSVLDNFKPDTLNGMFLEEPPTPTAGEVATVGWLRNLLVHNEIARLDAAKRAAEQIEATKAQTAAIRALNETQAAILEELRAQRRST